MVYVLAVATAALLGAILWRAHHRRLGRGLSAFILWMGLCLLLALLIRSLVAPDTPLWLAIGLTLVIGPMAFLTYYYGGGDVGPYGRR